MQISTDAEAGANAAARLQQQLDKLDEENKALIEQVLYSTVYNIAQHVVQ
jgi:hypothetical protein